MESRGSWSSLVLPSKEQVWGLGGVLLPLLPLYNVCIASTCQSFPWILDAMRIFGWREALSVSMTGTCWWHTTRAQQVEKNPGHTRCVLNLSFPFSAWLHINIDLLCAKCQHSCCCDNIFLLNSRRWLKRKNTVIAQTFLYCHVDLTHMHMFDVFCISEPKWWKTFLINLESIHWLLSWLLLNLWERKKKTVAPCWFCDGPSEATCCQCAALIYRSRASKSPGKQKAEERKTSDLSKRSNSILYLTPVSLNTLH